MLRVKESSEEQLHNYYHYVKNLSLLFNIFATEKPTTNQIIVNNKQTITHFFFSSHC